MKDCITRTLRDNVPARSNPHCFLQPPLLNAGSDTSQDSLPKEKVDFLFKVLEKRPSPIEVGTPVYQSQEDKLNHPQGARALTYTFPHDVNLYLRSRATLHINGDNVLGRIDLDVISDEPNPTVNKRRVIHFMQVISQSASTRPRSPRPSWAAPENVAAGRVRARTLSSSSAADERSAQRSRMANEACTSAALPTHAVATREINHAIADVLVEFQMSMHDLTEQQQQTLRAAAETPHAQQRNRIRSLLSAVQMERRIAEAKALMPKHVHTVVLAEQRTENNPFNPSYTGTTINGPHIINGEFRFYLEQQQQQERSCAQHAVNAMIGGPFISMTDFVEYEISDAQRTDQTALSQVAERIGGIGVFPETLAGTLRQRGIATHTFEFIPRVGLNGEFVSDPDQFRFLDALNTDRLLLQSNLVADESTGASHYVAFRRVGNEWMLLDSFNKSPEYGVSPSEYLENMGATHFTVIWPQHSLVSSNPEAIDTQQREASHLQARPAAPMAESQAQLEPPPPIRSRRHLTSSQELAANSLATITGSPASEELAAQHRPTSPGALPHVEQPANIMEASVDQAGQQAAFTEEEFTRNRMVGAALFDRGWLEQEIIGLKSDPDHMAILRKAHCNDQSLLEQLELHYQARLRLGRLLTNSNSLFVTPQATGNNQFSGRSLVKDNLTVPERNTVRRWRQQIDNEGKTIPLVPNHTLDLTLARRVLADLPKRHAWEKTCAPLVDLLLSQEHNSDVLPTLTWEALEKKLDNKTPAKKLKNNASRLGYGTRDSDLVFPVSCVPEGMSFTEYLERIRTLFKRTRA